MILHTAYATGYSKSELQLAIVELKSKINPSYDDYKDKFVLLVVGRAKYQITVPRLLHNVESFIRALATPTTFDIPKQRSSTIITPKIETLFQVWLDNHVPADKALRSRIAIRMHEIGVYETKLLQLQQDYDFGVQTCFHTHKAYLKNKNKIKKLHDKATATEDLVQASRLYGEIADIENSYDWMIQTDNVRKMEYAESALKQFKKEGLSIHRKDLRVIYEEIEAGAHSYWKLGRRVTVLIEAKKS